MDDTRQSEFGTTLPASSQVETLERGRTLGRYRIVDVLGRGGMGVVYLAFDAQLGRNLALKFLREERVTTSSHGGPRLLREAQAMARLTHPNVVSIYDVGTFGDRVFLAMEYVEGCTLTEWLKREHPWRERLAVLLQAGDGLRAAHEAGVIHRDFKSDNVLMGNDGRVLVTDFGLAGDVDRVTGKPLVTQGRLYDSDCSVPPFSAVDSGERGGHSSPAEQPTLPAAFSDRLTGEGAILGTIGFMAPEQADGLSTSAATDQFGYCVTAYFALYGVLPFPADTGGTYVRALRGPPAPPPPHSEVPAWVRNALLRGMRRDPDERFRSMSELLSALRRDPRAAWRKRAVVAGSLAIVAGVSAFGWATAQQRKLVCKTSSAEWTGIWDGEIRAAAKAAFAASDPLSGADTFERAASAIDAYVGQWDVMRGESCRATWLDQTQSEALYRQRGDCLARRKMELGKVTELLTHADRSVVDRGIAIGYGLPSITSCREVESGHPSFGLPSDATKRSAVLAVRGKLAEAESKKLAGKLKEADAAATEAVTMARAAAHGETTAEALLYKGRVLESEGAYAEAIGPLRESLGISAATGADGLVVRAATILAQVNGVDLEAADEASFWLDTAKAALKKMGGEEDLELSLLTTEANLRTAWAQPEAAIPIQEMVVVGFRRLYGVHRKTEVALFNIGGSYLQLGQPGHARPYLEEAVKIDATLGGPLYSELGTSTYLLGWSTVLDGDFDRGEGLLHGSIEILNHHEMPSWSAKAFQSLGWAALAKGDTAAAIAHGEMARTLHDKAKTSGAWSSGAKVVLGTALTRAGRAVEALPLCEEAITDQEKSAWLAPEKWYGWDALRCKAEALMALGKSGEAIPYLERSLRLTRRSFPGEYARVELALANALSATRKDAPRAEELAAKARDDFAKLIFLSFDNRQALAWGGKHTP